MRYIEEDDDIYKEESFKDMMNDLQEIRNNKLNKDKEDE